MLVLSSVELRAAWAWCTVTSLVSFSSHIVSLSLLLLLPLVIIPHYIRHTHLSLENPSLCLDCFKIHDCSFLLFKAEYLTYWATCDCTPKAIEDNSLEKSTVYSSSVVVTGECCSSMPSAPVLHLALAAVLQGCTIVQPVVCHMLTRGPHLSFSLGHQGDNNVIIAR